VGAVLYQEEDGIRQPIAYASRALSMQERNYCTYELECLAVLFGVGKFRPYLEHAELPLETENQALSWLLAHPRQLGEISRWIIQISFLKFRVHHNEGSKNVVADALPRMFDSEWVSEGNVDVRVGTRFFFKLSSCMC
jgi:hypothetical protein